MERRRFIKTTTLATLGLGITGGVYSWQIEPFWLEFVNQQMPINNLPQHLVGKTVLQISDIHVGKYFNYQYVVNAFKKAQALQPDFVVYTGDFVSYENEAQFSQLQEVMQYAVKGSIGTVGVLGNHDYGIAWKQQHVANKITGILEEAGIHILINKQKEFNGLNFIGIDEFLGLNFNPHKIMSIHNPNKPNIVLCHNPDVCDLDVWYNYKGWILSGHTHGGQVKLPFIGHPILPVINKKYTSGKIDLHDGRMLYINRALGNLKQIRFNVRPEITVFTLAKKS